MANLELPYSNAVVRLGIPSRNLRAVAGAKPMPGLPDLEGAVIKALDEPIGAPSLGRIASPGERVALIIDDPARPNTPTAKMLPLVLERLARAGVKLSDVEVVMAMGTHEKPPWEKVVAKVGADLSSQLKVHVHYALDKEEMTFLGVSHLGTPLWVNRHVAEADRKIGVGGIVPHPWAGYGGGGKIIMPGVSAWEAVGKHHLLALSRDSRIGKVEGNPFRRDAEDVAGRVGLDFVVNAVLNDRGETVDVVAGDYVKAQRRGAEVSGCIFKTSLEGLADVLVMAYGPRDETLWQVVGSAFTLVMAEQVVKEGGTVVLVASCDGGLYRFGKGVHHLNYKGDETGHDALLDMLKGGMRPEDVLSETIRGNVAYPELGVKGYLIARLAATRRIVLVSKGLEAKEVAWLGEVAAGVEEALAEALRTQGGNAEVVVIPHAATSRSFLGSGGRPKLVSEASNPKSAPMPSS